MINKCNSIDSFAIAIIIAFWSLYLGLHLAPSHVSNVIFLQSHILMFSVTLPAVSLFLGFRWHITFLHGYAAHLFLCY